MTNDRNKNKNCDSKAKEIDVFSFEVDLSVWKNPIDEEHVTGIYEDSDGDTKFLDINKSIEEQIDEK